jgi:hypothetical protein
MTAHWNRETVEDLTRRVAELKARIAEHEPVATTLKALWPVIDGYVQELRRVSTALATAESEDQKPHQAQWNSQMFMLISAFAIVEERLRLQASARYRLEAFLASASAGVKAAAFESASVGGGVESLMGDIPDLAKEDPELIRLLEVLSKRVERNKENLALIERALRDFVNRARIVFGGGRK